MFISKNIFCSILFPILAINFCLISSCKNKKNDIKKDIYVISPSVLYLNVDRDSTYESTVYVKNQSQDQLRILEISSSCGCTVGVLKDSTLHPFDSVALKIKYTPNKVDSGQVIRFVSLRTNGALPVKSLEIRANITSK